MANQKICKFSQLLLKCSEICACQTRYQVNFWALFHVIWFDRQKMSASLWNSHAEANLLKRTSTNISNDKYGTVCVYQMPKHSFKMPPEIKPGQGLPYVRVYCLSHGGIADLHKNQNYQYHTHVHTHTQLILTVTTLLIVYTYKKDR